MKCLKSSAAIFAIALVSTGCLVGGKITPTLDAPAERDIAQLWQEPADIATRDLFYGPGGAELMPRGSQTFAFVAADRSGYSAGYDVRDANGLEWSVKVGPEAQPEIAVSRILWALGYHQPPTYYLPSWMMTGTQSGLHPAGRFRPKLPNHKVVGEWSWYENDFINSQPFMGLVVVNVLLNNWDWKTSNNKIYEIADEGQPVDRVFLVQDLGASLGKTSYPKLLAWLPMRGLGQGSRNDLADFEEQGFIKRVDGERVEFFYDGIHESLIERLTPGDVVWAAELMSRLSDAQWHDAFRAAGYSGDEGRRYVAKIKSKIDEGLKLRPEA
jgi:hypothetical protein